MKRFIIAALWLLAVGSYAVGQQLTNHAVPIGRGAGVTGFNAAGPCSAGGFLVYAGATSDPACSTVASDLVILMSTNAGAGIAPDLVMVRNSASPAANDNLAAIQWQANNSVLTPKIGISISGLLQTATSTAEDFNLFFQLTRGGSALTTEFVLGGGAVVGSPSGGALGVGILNSTGLVADGLFNSRTGQIVTNLESINIRASNQMTVQAIGGGASESTALYCSVVPTGGVNLFCIDGQVSSAQVNGAGGFMKIAHYGHGDAVFVAVRNDGFGLEAALFANNATGFLGSLQTGYGAGSIPFNCLNQTTTVLTYGCYFASQSPARALTIQQYTSFTATDEQIRFANNGLTRNIWQLNNSGDTIQTAAAATSGVTIVNSPQVYLRGTYWNGSASVDANVILRNTMISTSPSHRFSVLLGPTGSEATKFEVTNSGNVLMTSTVAGAGTGPNITFTRSVTGVNGNLGGAFTWSQQDASNNAISGIVMFSELQTATAGATDFRLFYQAVRAGTLADELVLGGGVLIGSSAGVTMPGAGHLQAQKSIKSRSATDGVGYATGAGGTVTQATSKATAVTLNTITGKITMDAATLNAATVVTFVFNNSAIVATDIIATAHESGGTTGAYTINCRATGAGTAACDVRNNTAGNLSEAVVIRFAVIKSVNSFLLNRDLHPANDNHPAFMEIAA